MARKQDKSEPPHPVLCRIRDQVATEINQLLEENKGRFTQEELVSYLIKNGCTVQNGNYLDASHLSRRKKLVSEIPSTDLKSIWETFEEQYTISEIALIKQFFREKNGEGVEQTESRVVESTTAAGECMSVPQKPSKEVLLLDVRGEQPFIREINHPFFKGYAGQYYCYFHSTVTHEDEIISGQLQLFENEEDGSCEAELVLDIRPEKKQYTGKLLISDKMRICYCLLHGKSTGELCLIVFEYFGIHGKNRRLKYRVAEVVTVSAGGGNRPTAHRMLISYKSLTKDQQLLIGAQLRMNKRFLCIKASVLEEFLKSYPQFQWAYDKILRIAEKDEYYRFSESEITDQKDFTFQGHCVSVEDTALCMCLLREAANAPKNNKVSTSVDNIVRIILDSENIWKKKQRRKQPLRQKGQREMQAKE